MSIWAARAGVPGHDGNGLYRDPDRDHDHGYGVSLYTATSWTCAIRLDVEGGGMNGASVVLTPARARELAAQLLEVSDYAQARSDRSEEHTSELQSRENLVCRL